MCRENLPLDFDWRQLFRHASWHAVDAAATAIVASIAMTSKESFVVAVLRRFHGRSCGSSLDKRIWCPLLSTSGASHIMSGVAASRLLLALLRERHELTEKTQFRVFLGNISPQRHESWLCSWPQKHKIVSLRWQFQRKDMTRACISIGQRKFFKHVIMLQMRWQHLI